MKYGHRLKLEIHAYDEKGRGLGEIEILPGESRDVAVPFSAIGDEIEATFVKREYGLKVCHLDNVIKPGPDRIQALCPHAGTCGGCLWQHLAYPAQLAEKERGLAEMFAALGLTDRLKPIIPADATFGYRNRMDFCVGWNGEVGLKEYGSWNKYVNVKECLLLQSSVNSRMSSVVGGHATDDMRLTTVGDILQFVRDWMKEFDLQPWDAKFHSGDVRYVVIRDGQNTEQRMITVVVRDASRMGQSAKGFLIDKLKAGCTSLLLGEQPKDTDLSLAETFETLIGELWLEEKVNDVTYRIHPNSFFQTNTAMAARLQDTVFDSIRTLRTAGTLRTLLDLYCGLGFFGIAAAKADPTLQVMGYESDEEAIKLASQNAEMNEVGKRCHFFAGKAEGLSWKDIDAQCVILDPPRSGLHPRVIKTLLDETSALQPSTLIYVSCNYRRLKEELPLLMQKFEVTSIQPLDLFPQTSHVEVVTVLRRKRMTLNA